MGPLKAKKATYADIEALFETVVGQILDGELVAFPRPSFEHSICTSALGGLLNVRFQQGIDGQEAGGSWTSWSFIWPTTSWFQSSLGGGWLDFAGRAVLRSSSLRSGCAEALSPDPRAATSTSHAESAPAGGGTVDQWLQRARDIAAVTVRGTT